MLYTLQLKCIFSEFTQICIKQEASWIDSSQEKITYRVELEYRFFLSIDSSLYRMRMRSPSCPNVDSYSVTFTDMKLFSDINVTTVIYQRAN